MKEEKEELIIDEKFVKPYFGANGKRYGNYWKALDQFWHLSFHFDGYFMHIPSKGEIAAFQATKSGDDMDGNPYFQRLIDMRRPSESDTIKIYRRDIYLPESMSPCFKVYNSLRKIVKSPDWKIDYSDSLRPSSIADGEYLEDYCEQSYPDFNSVENWFYTYGMRKMLIDANALCYVLPKDFDIEPNEYYKPIAQIVHCKDVYDFKENEYAIFKVDCDYQFTTSGDIKRKGQVLGIITKDGYWEARQRSMKMDFDLVEVMTFETPMKYLPAFMTGGVVKKYSKDNTIYNSFLAPMLPGLDGMARAISDEDAEWVQHVYSTMWYLSMQDCRVCMGKGYVNGKGKQSITCSECNGTGGAPKSPYRDMVIKAGTFDSDKIPTPPAGYIQKDTKIAEIFKERIKDKEYRSLASVNFEFLAQTPAVNSGISKAYDRQETDTFTYTVAYHSVENFIKNIYYFINEFRYSTRVPNEDERYEMLPIIPIPRKYDLLTSSALINEIEIAKKADLDPEIIDKYEMELLCKEFPDDTDLRDRMNLKKSLDPFPRIDKKDLADLLLAGSIDKIDATVSIYIHKFIEKALFEYKSKPLPSGKREGIDFVHKPFDKQMEVIYKYAQEVIDKTDAAQNIKAKAQLEKFKSANPVKDNLNNGNA